MILLNKRFFDALVNAKGLVHISGSAGSGKTLLAAAVAARVSRSAHVDWLSTDGKSGFIDYLRRNMNYYGGLTSNLTVTRTITNSDALAAVLGIKSRLNYNSRLVIVDPITRVLDMSRSDDLLWGRALFEEALPTLAGVADSGDLLLLVISEVRESHLGVQAVYHKKIKPWIIADYILERPYGRRNSQIFESNGDGAKGVHVATMQLSEDGEVKIRDETSQVEAY